MNSVSDQSRANTKGLLLPGLDGTNPLGFLAALGVFVILSDNNDGNMTPKLSWRQHSGTWVPYIYSMHSDIDDIAETIDNAILGPSKNPMIREKLEEIYKHAVKPNDSKWQEWLNRLERYSVSYDLSIGRAPNQAVTPYLGHNIRSLDRPTLRRLAALAAAHKNGQQLQVSETAFCFTTGSGHQWFLQSIQMSLLQLKKGDICRLLDKGIIRSDEKYSVRLDPDDDRRHAYMWGDPGGKNEDKPKTCWAANVMAYYALYCYPCVPVRTHGSRMYVASAGWQHDGGNGNPLAYRWPIWTDSLSLWDVCSLITHPLMSKINVDVEHIKHLGIKAIMESGRIVVGSPPNTKTNFVPSVRIV